MIYSGTQHVMANYVGSTAVDGLSMAEPALRHIADPAALNLPGQYSCVVEGLRAMLKVAYH
jgi:hypothetical protein